MFFIAKLAICALICFNLLSDVCCDEDVCSLQSCSDAVPPNGSFVDDCDSHPMMRLQGHCCVNMSSDHIIGIDLSYCNLVNIKTLFHQSVGVEKINLTHNPNLKYENTSFLGLKKLKQLSLDKKVDCPGQWNWFNTTWQAWNDTKVEKHLKRCINQTDTCTLLKEDHNYTCPENSECKNNGPGLFLCECKTGWGGYRCLRKTDAHLEIPILTGTASATILLSALLWYTQRRHIR